MSILKDVFYVTLNSEGSGEAELLSFVENCHPEYLEDDEERYTLEVEVSVKLIDNFDESVSDTEELVRRIDRKFGIQ